MELNWFKKKTFDISQAMIKEPRIEEFIANKLGSIDLTDVRNKTKTEDEFKAYQTAISAVFKDYIEPTIKMFIIAQEEFMARQAVTVDQLSVGRGTINGLFLLLDEFENCYKTHQGENITASEPDQTNMFPEIPTVESMTVK